MNEEKIKEVFSDEAFVKDLFASKSYEEAQAKLKDKGIDLSVDEIKKIIEFLKENKDGELSEEELENVSGGATPLVVTIVLATEVVLTGTGVGFGIAHVAGCI